MDKTSEYIKWRIMRLNEEMQELRQEKEHLEKELESAIAFEEDK